ncbi:MAG: stage 0 sporulation protein [Candidatus Latescibacteria bacterium]|nr:stage 0 sporulation protein [bacterium]MBD3422920.1 stage 0 sporulation protein [Candidatus Latescibacterota bacterium]
MEIVEVKFKSLRREVYKNSKELNLQIGNYCIVEADRGEDMGTIENIYTAGDEEIENVDKEIIRHATEEDEIRLQEARSKEKKAEEVCQTKVEEHDLPMKLIDVEYQFDCNKITFFFTAESRVDFRELVRDLAAVFKTRIDLHQIGVRDEARRFDGVGMCGRKLCCSTFIKEFEPITLKMAKEQNLPLTPAKISGVCGRLMCCLNYELDVYRELKKGVPKEGSIVSCFGGEYKVGKISIFDRTISLIDSSGNTVISKLRDFKKELGYENRNDGD